MLPGRMAWMKKGRLCLSYCLRESWWCLNAFRQMIIITFSKMTVITFREMTIITAAELSAEENTV